MNNNLMVFENKNVEVFNYDGKALFNPRHVGEILGLSDISVRRAIQGMTTNQVLKLKNSGVHSMNIRKLNNAGENFLTESGVYKLIFKSRKEEAERFQDWVTDVVLPALRKDGAYIVGEEKFVSGELSEDELVLRAMTLMQNKVDRLHKEKLLLQAENESMKPIVGLADKLINSNGTWDIGILARIFDIPKLGRNNLFKWLKNKEILMSNNIPYQKYQQYFKIITVTKGYGETHLKALVKPEGVKYIYKKLVKDGKIIEKSFDEILEELEDKVA